MIEKIHPGDIVEHISKNCFDETFTVISTDSRMKLESNEWVTAFIYSSNRENLRGTWRVISEKEFYQRFKKVAQ